MTSADTIIWLDVGCRVAAWRIVYRHTSRSIARDNPHPGVRRLIWLLSHDKTHYTSDTSLLPSSPIDDGAVTRVVTGEMLAPYASKVRRCETNADVTIAIRELEQNR